jgi:beta-aspartyl-dipeptidase (metallo-type)
MLVCTAEPAVISRGNRMLTLIRNAEVFAPEPLGRREVLIAGSRVAGISDSVDIRGDLLEVVDADGLWLLPGFVDALTHPCGGGGEGGFGNRTGEIDFEAFVRAGITTPVGALGTDSITRSLEVLYGHIMGLREQGLSALMFSGSYRVPGVTLTGDLARDMLLVEPVIGAGEVAIADHRSSQPTAGELRRLAADVHLGGTLSGKRGTVLVHVGDGPSGLELIEAALDNSELPRWLFYPTHVNRRPELLRQAIDFAGRGGFVDITVSTTEDFIEAGEVPALQAFREAIEAGAPAGQLTFSSDAGGSLPLYRDGVLVGLQAASPTALLELLNTAVTGQSDLVPAVIAALTRNPAMALGLASRGCLAVGKDADLLLYDPQSGQLQEVFCSGRRLMPTMVRD